MAAGAARVRVSFQVDADGLVSVTAREQRSGAAATIVVKPSYGLADVDIARMLEASVACAAEDMQARALREQQVESGRLLEAVAAALAADADLLDASERGDIETRMQRLQQAVAGRNAIAIKDAIAALNHATSDFAARRMDASIRKVLAGRKLAAIDA
jgi:molecular chaperone HscA